MEPEFRQRNLPSGGPSYSDLVIQALRKSREEHPAADMVAGNLPFVGAMQAGMDVTDPNESNLSRGLALASIVPGGKLAGAVVKRLRNFEHRIPAGAADKMFGAKQPFTEFKSTTPKETVESANEAYTRQLMAEMKDDIPPSAKEVFESRYPGEKGPKVVPIGQQKMTAEKLRSKQNRSVQARADAERIATSPPSEAEDFILGPMTEEDLAWFNGKQELHVEDQDALKTAMATLERLKQARNIPMNFEERLVDKTGQLPVPSKPPQAIIDSMKAKAAAGDASAQAWLEKFGE